MMPWVTAMVSELCKTPLPASACDVRAAAALGSRPAVLARMVRGSRGTVATVTPMHVHTPPHTGAPDAHLSHTACSRNSITRTKSIALVTGCPLRTSAPPPRATGLTLHLTVAAPKRWLHCCTLCHSHLCSYVTNICVLACLIFLHPVFKILKILNFKNLLFSTDVFFSEIKKFCFLVCLSSDFSSANHSPLVPTSCWVLNYEKESELCFLSGEDSIDVGWGQDHTPRCQMGDSRCLVARNPFGCPGAWRHAGDGAAIQHLFVRGWMNECARLIINFVLSFSSEIYLRNFQVKNPAFCVYLLSPWNPLHSVFMTGVLSSWK